MECRINFFKTMVQTMINQYWLLTILYDFFLKKIKKMFYLKIRCFRFKIYYFPNNFPISFQLYFKHESLIYILLYCDWLFEIFNHIFKKYSQKCKKKNVSLTFWHFILEVKYVVKYHPHTH